MMTEEPLNEKEFMAGLLPHVTQEVGMKGILNEGHVCPGIHRGKKSVVDMTDYILHGNIQDLCFHELRQHLPCFALFLYRFDDDEEKFDQPSGKALITADKVPVKKMIMYVNVDQHESGSNDS